MSLNKEEAAEQLHQVLLLALVTVYYDDHCQVVTLRDHLMTTPRLAPNDSCNHYR